MTDNPTTTLTFRLKQSERRELEVAAAIANQPLTTWIRDVALSVARVTRPSDTPNYDALLEGLSKVEPDASQRMRTELARERESAGYANDT